MFDLSRAIAVRFARDFQKSLDLLARRKGFEPPDPQIRSLVLYPAELPALAPDPSRKAGRPRCYRCGDEPASDYKLVHPKPH